MAALYPMVIQPHFDERIWGGNALATRLGKAAPRDKPIGESWEIYEENVVVNGPYKGQTIGQLRGVLGRDLMGHVSPDTLFPLLTKFIDARDVLSVQVHPDDQFARAHLGQPYGKTECWYILDAAPGAALTYGFARDTNPEEYARMVADGKLEEILRSLPVRSGDVVYIPAGAVHAIGAGIILYELQQTSDVTYRIYDWNRRDAAGHTRELHVEQAQQVLDYHHWTRGTVRPLRQADGTRAMLIAGPYFTLELIEADEVCALETAGSPIALCTLDRAMTVEAGGMSVALPPYTSALVPAAARSYSLAPASGDGIARALVASIPESPEAVRDDLHARGINAAEVDSFLAQFAPARDLGQAATGAAR